jgi:hypothetical protein
VYCRGKVFYYVPYKTLHCATLSATCYVCTLICKYTLLASSLCAALTLRSMLCVYIEGKHYTGKVRCLYMVHLFFITLPLNISYALLRVTMCSTVVLVCIGVTGMFYESYTVCTFPVDAHTLYYKNQNKKTYVLQSTTGQLVHISLHIY